MSEYWCLAWRTPRMPASAFWYFHTEAEALNAASDLWSTATWTIKPVMLTEHQAQILSGDGAIL